jgi:hypothetical protein
MKPTINNTPILKWLPPRFRANVEEKGEKGRNHDF